MTKAIRVVVSGSAGKMGREVVKTVLGELDMMLVGAVDPEHVGKDAAIAAGEQEPCGIIIQKDLRTVLFDTACDVCVDFTHPDIVFENAQTIIKAAVRPVIGTTGLTNEQMDLLNQKLAEKDLGGMVVPNFAIGAVLMIKFAEYAARYFDHAEIIELHHNQKADAPSGTALKTAEKMASAGGGKQFAKTNAAEKETIAGSRGGVGPANIHIHSVRLPGFVAHQEIIFGDKGQILTLRHDSLDRVSFMPGVALAVRKVMTLPGLVYGLEHVL